MPLLTRIAQALILMSLLGWTVFTLSNAQAAGLLTPTQGTLPPLEIRSHDVQVSIEDGYAITQVDQAFHNPHAQDLEAIYSFPVPEHAAVAEFTVWIDAKPVTGEVLPKQEARKIYEEEKAAGHEAGLTEKDSYKSFDIHVHPVRAGQDTRIRLVYLQTAHVDTGIGRYVYPLEEGGVDEHKLAFWTANEAVRERFSFRLKLKPGYPVNALRAPDLPQALISQNKDGSWELLFESHAQGVPQEGETATAQPTQPAFTLDRDIVTYWRHAPDLPGSVDLVAYKPEAGKRGTFMLSITPGDDLKPITEGRDWVFVLDLSGSMQGKFASLAEGVERALKAMTPADRFRIVLFNERSWELTAGFVNATPENIAHYARQVRAQNPSKGTHLYAGLERGLDDFDADRTGAIVLVTDGVANVGETAQRKFLDLIAKKDLRLFTFIMGNSANRPLLEAITRASHGFSQSVSNSDDIVGQLLLAGSKVSHQALHDVRIDIQGVKTADLTPQVIGSVYRGQQIILLGHYWGEGEARVSVKGRISGAAKTYQTRFDFPAVATDNPELERLWAYASIEHLMGEMEDFGEQADLKQAVTDLALEYSLVTDYTSMLVLRDEVFDQRGIDRGNRQRLDTEREAQARRAQTPAQSRRVDTQQPMYSSQRADTRRSRSSGGGAFNAWGLVPLLALLPLLRRKARGAKA